MNISLKDAIARGWKIPRAATCDVTVPKRRAKRGTGAAAQKKQMNRWEREYGGQLELRRIAAEILGYGFERIKLKLADGTFYTPDYYVLTLAGLEFHEVKGFQRDDAIVKFKVAAEMFPHFRFVMVTKKGGRWETIRDLNSAEAA